MVDRRQKFAVLTRNGDNYIYERGSIPVAGGSVIVYEKDEKTGTDENTQYRLRHGQKREDLGLFFLQNWWALNPPTLYFVNLRNSKVSYEIDFWSCLRVGQLGDNDDVCAVLELRDSSRPTSWPSERMHRMHELMTSDMTAVMVKNLTTTASSAGNGGKRQAIESLTGEPVSVQISENYRKMPLALPPNSPYAVRLSHVRRSIYNAGLETLREFDEKARHWEVDLAANDLVSWKTLVKATVTGVAIAIISTAVDERKDTELEISEMVAARLLQPHQQPYSRGQFLREAAMAALWDCGIADMYPDITSEEGIDLTQEAQINQYLDSVKEKLAADECMPEDDRKQLEELLQKDRVQSIFKAPAVYKSRLMEASDRRRQRALRQLSEGPPPMQTEAELTFVDQVWTKFQEKCNINNCLTLMAYNAEIPLEGLGYTPPTLHFGVCNFDSEGHMGFSVGHGVGLMVETTEVAVAFLQESPWAKATRARAQSANSTVDKPIREDGIDVDSPAGSFPANAEELVYNPIALETHVAPMSPTATTAMPYRVLTATSQTLSAEQRRNLERTWWKRPPPQQTDILPVPGVSNAVFVNRDDERSSDRQTAYLNCFLAPGDLADWLATHFIGGVFERQSVLERPVFAKLSHCEHIRHIKEMAELLGFVDLSTTGGNVDGKELLYAAMKHEISEHTATGRRMNHLLQPFLVYVTSNSCGSHMMVETYWGPKRDFFAVEAESSFIFREVCNSLYRSSSQRTSGINEGTLGEKAQLVGFHHLHELLEMVEDPEKRKTAAGVVVRLIEAVQSSNESVKDSGKVHRQKEARAHVDMARTGYATLLAKIRVN